MEEIFYSRKKKSSNWSRVLLVYVLLVVIRLLFLEYGFRVVSIKSSEYESLKKYENAKVLVLSSPYMLSFFKILRFSRKPAPKQNDLVLLHSFGYKNMGGFSKILYYTLDSLSLGIIKTKKIYTIQRVAFLPGQRFQFSSKKLLARGEFETANNKKDSEQQSKEQIEAVPFFDELHDAVLQQDEVFLEGSKEYELDSRLLGAVKLSSIKGRALFILHPYWEAIPEQ